MVSNQIKEATKVAHQELEKTVVLQLKAVRSEADYANILKNFYAYFNAVEKAIAPYITSEVLPDYTERRNSSYIKQDIEDLGANIIDLPIAHAPAINNTVEALGALYVLEGSIMGGPYIVQMLQKYGMQKGFGFFSGYGENTGKMWGTFTAAMNSAMQTEEEKKALIDTAQHTFLNFGDVFQQQINA